MSLRDQALADVGAILESTLDFGQAITLTDPAGTSTPMTGWSNDISTSIDPDTGALVKGRRVHVTLRIASLPAGPRPVAQNDKSLKPWLVSFPRITTAVVTQYAVIGTVPDDSVGSIIVELGEYIP
jgi:hypothetical protein